MSLVCWDMVPSIFTFSWEYTAWKWKLLSALSMCAERIRPSETSAVRRTRVYKLWISLHISGHLPFVCIKPWPCF